MPLGEWLFIMLYSMALGINDVQLYVNLCYLQPPVCGLPCSREQQQGFTLGKEKKPHLVSPRFRLVLIAYQGWLLVSCTRCCSRSCRVQSHHDCHIKDWTSIKLAGSFNLLWLVRWWISSLNPWLQFEASSPTISRCCRPLGLAVGARSEEVGDATVTPVTPVPAPAFQTYRAVQFQQLWTEPSL